MPGTKMSVIIVEDDRSVRDMLGAVLGHEGYEVTSMADGEALLDGRAAFDAGLVILDVGLPGASGLDLCRRLRRDGRTGPILILTARHEIDDRVAGLDAGADDYLVKPFALDELLARVRAALRRATSSESGTGSELLVLGDLEIDPTTREVWRDGARLGLTKIEFDLLHLLVSSSPAVVTRDVIHDRVWGFDADHMSNSLEVFVSQLRKKTEIGGRARVVHTVRQVGYVARIGS